MNAAPVLWNAIKRACAARWLSWATGLALGIILTLALPDVNFLPGAVLTVSILALGRIVTELRNV